MVERKHPRLSVTRQCALLEVSRASVYYQPAGVSHDEQELMKLMDRQYMATPFYGSRRMTVWLRGQDHRVNRKRVQRLMRAMGLKAIYRRPRTSQPAARQKVYPYLLRGLEISWPNQVWAGRSPISPWPGGSYTWWPSWIGTAATC